MYNITVLSQYYCFIIFYQIAFVSLRDVFQYTYIEKELFILCQFNYNFYLIKERFQTLKRTVPWGKNKA